METKKIQLGSQNEINDNKCKNEKIQNYHTYLLNSYEHSKDRVPSEPSQSENVMSTRLHPLS